MDATCQYTWLHHLDDEGLESYELSYTNNVVAIIVAANVGESIKAENNAHLFLKEKGSSDWAEIILDFNKAMKRSEIHCQNYFS